jgi:uncharacterized protein YbjT (DUF2867 family)
MPILPLFGTGDVKLQPVYVRDVAEAVARALGTEAASSKIYELGGPRAYTYRALLQLPLQQLGRKRLLMPVPYLARELLAAFDGTSADSADIPRQIVLMKTRPCGEPQGIVLC